LLIASGSLGKQMVNLLIFIRLRLIAVEPREAC
jgi:hypothetical protein